MWRNVVPTVHNCYHPLSNFLAHARSRARDPDDDGPTIYAYHTVDSRPRPIALLVAALAFSMLGRGGTSSPSSHNGDEVKLNPLRDGRLRRKGGCRYVC